MSTSGHEWVRLSTSGYDFVRVGTSWHECLSHTPIVWEKVYFRPMKTRFFMDLKKETPVQCKIEPSLFGLKLSEFFTSGRALVKKIGFIRNFSLLIEIARGVD